MIDTIESHARAVSRQLRREATSGWCQPQTTRPPADLDSVIGVDKAPGFNDRPLVLFLMGRRGEGKTLAMTALARMQKSRFAKFRMPNGARKRVVSNYRVSFADRSDPYLLDDLIKFPEQARNLFICVDEVGSAFPNRRSLAAVNVDFSNFLTQIRKRNIEVCFTTQFPQVIDYQLLMQVDLFIRCEKFWGGRGVRLWYHDFWGQWTGKDHRKKWPPDKREWDWYNDLTGTDAVWGTYDTGELVAAINSSTRDQMIESQWDLPKPVAPQLVSVPDMAPAETLEEYLFRHAGGSFDLLAHLTTAKKFEPSITNLPTFAVWLEANGHETWKDGGKFFARMPE